MINVSIKDFNQLKYSNEEIVCNNIHKYWSCKNGQWAGYRKSETVFPFIKLNQKDFEMVLQSGYSMPVPQDFLRDEKDDVLTSC